MKKITVIGAGKMGSEISRALYKKGFSMTTYDTFAENAQKLESEGINVADTPLKAVEESEIILFSINSYQGCFAFLKEEGVLDQLANKIVLQLSTGTPAEVAELERLLEGKNSQYLEGKIMCYPQEIGTENAFMIYSGNKSLYKKLTPVLNALSEAQTFVNDQANGAATLDLSILTTYYGLHWSIFQGAMICKQNGIPLTIFTEATKEYALHTVEEIMDNSIPTIAKGSFGSDMASNTVHAAALEQCMSAIDSSKLDPTVAKEILALFKKAIKQGDAEKNIESITSVMVK